MSGTLELKRRYDFSDTFGGVHGDPLRDPDPDARISTDFDSDPLHWNKREFDILHDPEVVHHILRLVVQKQREIDSKGYLTEAQKREAGVTGVMINSAPREEAGVNGHPFYFAILDHGRVRVVAPPHALSSVKSIIDELYVLPNVGNGLYPDGTQFRSASVGWLVNGSRHRIRLDVASQADIPDFPDGCRVSFVDRFGNVVTYSHQREAKSEGVPFQTALPDVLNDPAALGEMFRLRVGDVERSFRWVQSMNHAPRTQTDPRENRVFYPNGGNVDLIRAWAKGETMKYRLDTSAYVQLHYPSVGTPVEIIPESAA